MKDLEILTIGDTRWVDVEISGDVSIGDDSFVKLDKPITVRREQVYKYHYGALREDPRWHNRPVLLDEIKKALGIDEEDKNPDDSTKKSWLSRLFSRSRKIPEAKVVSGG